MCVLVFSLLGGAVSLLIALTNDEKWLVSAKLLLQIGPETAGTRPSMVGSPAPFLAGNPRREDVQTEVELLSNPDLLRRAFETFRTKNEAAALGPQSGAVGSAGRQLMEAIGLLPARSREDRALDRWANSLRIAVVPASTVLVVECRSARPDDAVQLLELLIELYLFDHRSVFGARGMSPVLLGLVVAKEGSLATTEATLSRLRTEHRVVDVVQETSQWILSRSTADTRAREVQGLLGGATARLQVLEAVLNTTPPELRSQQEQRPNPLRDDLEMRLATARQDLVMAEQQFMADSPEIRRARDVEQLLLQLAHQATPTRDAGVVMSRNPLHDSLVDLIARTRAEQAALTAQLAAATAAVAAIEARLLQLEQARGPLQKAEQDVLEAKKDLTQAHEGLRLARIEELLDEHQVANVTLVAKPGYLPTPLRSFGLPSRITIVLGGLFLGGGAALVWILWRSSRRREQLGPTAPSP